MHGLMRAFFVLSPCITIGKLIHFSEELVELFGIQRYRVSREFGPGSQKPSNSAT